jgi:hypothetical protein
MLFAFPSESVFAFAGIRIQAHAWATSWTVSFMGVVLPHHCVGIFSIGSDRWMRRLAQELQERFIRAIQQIEAAVREYPIIGPIGVQDPVFADV